MLSLLCALYCCGSPEVGAKETSSASESPDRVTVFFQDRARDAFIVYVYPGGTFATRESDREDTAILAKSLVALEPEGVLKIAIRVEEPKRTSVDDLFKALHQIRKHLTKELPEKRRAVLYVAGPLIPLDADTKERTRASNGVPERSNRSNDMKMP